MAEQGGLKVQCFVNDSYVPIDKIRAGTRLVLTLAMAIPTAKPSGILCKVIASNKSLFLERVFVGPSF